MENIDKRTINKIIHTGRKKIGFDIDGTTAETLTPTLNLFNRLNNTGYNRNQVVDPDQFDIWAKEIDLPKQFVHDLWNTPIVIRNGTLIGGVAEVVDFLTSADAELHWITSRPSRLSLITLHWFERYFPDVPLDNVHIQRTGNGLIPNFIYKNTMIQNLGLDLYFEDMSSHAVDIVRQNPNIIVALVAQPWNLEFRENSSNERIVYSRDDSGFPMLDAFRALDRLS